MSNKFLKDIGKVDNKFQMPQFNKSNLSRDVEKEEEIQVRYTINEHMQFTELKDYTQNRPNIQ